jgi:hypothetical protein
MAEQDDLSSLIFRLKAVDYRATLTDAAFDLLLDSKPPKGAVGGPDRTTAVVSDLLYEVAREHEFSLPSLGHLARALLAEDRVAEAAMFCDLWIESAPGDQDALVFRALIACRMFDLPAATRAFESLRARGAGNGLLFGIDTMIILSFSDGSKSADRARAMLEAGCDKVWAIPLAAEAAFRAGDADLLLRVGSRDPSLLDEPPVRQQRAQQILRARLIELLDARQAG